MADHKADTLADRKAADRKQAGCTEYEYKTVHNDFAENLPAVQLAECRETVHEAFRPSAGGSAVPSVHFRAVAPVHSPAEQGAFWLRQVWSVHSGTYFRQGLLFWVQELQLCHIVPSFHDSDHLVAVPAVFSAERFSTVHF